MERLAPRWTFPDGPHDARLEGFALKGVGAWHAGGKVLKTVMKPNAWKIPKTRLGIPLKRTRAGVVLYKMPTDTLCRQQALL